MGRRLLLVAVAALVASLVPACSGGGERLVVYSGRSEDLIGPLLQRFVDETDIKIDVKYADSADLALLIESEGERSPADVFISQSPGAIGYLDGKDKLAELPSEVLDRVDEDFRAVDGRWVGLSGRVRVLVYNAEDVAESELPDSILDLTGPEYQGRVAVAPTNGSFIDFVTAMRQQLGDDEARAWLEAMADNDSPTFANNNAIVQAVARGEVEMGLVNHYYNARAEAEDPGIDSENHYFPAEGDLGSLLITTGASTLATADKAEEAGRLIEFFLSEESQRFFADETFEYPLIEGVEPAGGIPALADLTVTRVDLDELGDGLRGTQALIDSSGIGDG